MNEDEEVTVKWSFTYHISDFRFSNGIVINRILLLLKTRSTTLVKLLHGTFLMTTITIFFIKELTELTLSRKCVKGHCT